MKSNLTNTDSVEPDLELEFDLDPSDPSMVHPDPFPIGQKTVCLCWQLICPPKNWQEPIPIEAGEVRLMEMLSQRLNLVFTRDDKRRKIYLGNDHAHPEEVTSGLRFPSGWTADIVEDEEAGDEYEAIDQIAAAPLIPAFPDAQLSKNFRLSEFRSREHYDFIRLSPMLVNALEEIRQKAGGQPLHVTSGYRPPAYNRKVGGVSNSTHIDGLAADIYSDHMSTEELYDICDRVIGDRGGVGYYPTQDFIHIDLRGYRARW
jgi:Peptidase M15